MSTAAFVLIATVGTLVALRNWRAGVAWAIAVGMLQDPIRKLTPGAPPIMAISSLPVWAAVVLKLRLSERETWSRFRRDWPRVVRRMTIFVFLLFPAVVMGFQYGLEAWRLVVISVLGYVAPLIGIVMGYAYVERLSQLRALFVFYCALTSVMMAGSILEYAKVFPDWGAVGTSALGVKWIRYPEEGVFDLISGFYRSPDIMGWHAATLTMLALTLVLADGGGRGLRWLPPAVLGALCLLISGRRKMIVMPAIWVGVATIAYLRAGRASRLVPIAVAATLTLVGFNVAASRLEVGQAYFEYAGSTSEAAPVRLWRSSWESLSTTLSQAGVLGDGLGAASQGGQHVAGTRQRSWQESGLSKLLVELGVPGFVWALVLAATLARALSKSLDLVRLRENAFLVGVVGFCAANAASFIISHQVYGDLLTMILTAFLVGVALAGRRWLDVSTR